ncbi:hypothetical protein HU200_003456 [Digitaria exilis]|uniref:F-box domain-containing protein n=1 Tax=Digitaria exilis TaxID=1010633 RepID=A0A835KW54_9POAL|nr:hypothetical protein HU200_003456 [Digitaria exilis]
MNTAPSLVLMEKDCRRRRRSKTSDDGPGYSHGGVTASSHDGPSGRLTNIDDLADDLLELVLLHIPSPVTILRAGATCRRWRRMISNATFLRRLPPSLQSPYVVGHYYAGMKTSLVLKPSPPPGDESHQKMTIAAVDYVRRRVSHGIILPQDYKTHTMDLTDSHGGLLAFVRYDSTVVVYDPFTWEYREVYLPAAATAPAPGRFSTCLGAFFLDAGADDDTVTTRLSLLNLRMLCVCLVSESERHGHDDEITSLTAMAFVFSATENRWILLNSTVLKQQDDMSPEHKYNEPYVYRFVGRMEGSLVWSVRGCKVIHVDESSGEFSTFTLPSTSDHSVRKFLMDDRWNLRLVGRVVDGGDAGIRLARIVGTSDLLVLRCVSAGGGGGGEVMVERTANISHLANMEARLPWCFLETEEAVPAGSVIVVVLPSGKCEWAFTTDVDTMELKRSGPKRNWRSGRLLPHELPWPPPIRRVPVLMQEDSRRLRSRTSTPTRLTNIDDLQELILLRIPSPVAILRAGATCRRWRRLISETSFLRRLPPSL